MENKKYDPAVDLTKTASVGACNGAFIGSSVGILASLGLMTILGFEALGAADSIITEFNWLIVGGLIGGLCGAFMGFGTPESEIRSPSNIVY